MDEFEQKSREVAQAILKRHGWKRPRSAELKEMRGVIDMPYSECKRYLVEEWQNVRVPLLEKEIEQLRNLFRDFWTWADPPFALNSGSIEGFESIYERARKLDIWGEDADDGNH